MAIACFYLQIPDPRRTRRWLCVGLLLLLLAGCGPARPRVLEPVRSPVTFERARVVPYNAVAVVPADISARLQSAINTALFEDGPFVPGPGLIIEYAFITLQAGNPSAGWFWGLLGNDGEALVLLQVRYLDIWNNELAAVQVVGRSAGFFGGSIAEAIEQAGQRIADFAIEKFR